MCFGQVVAGRKRRLVGGQELVACDMRSTTAWRVARSGYRERITVGKTRLAGSHLAILDFTPLAIIRPVCNVMVIYPSWLVKTGK